MSALSFDHRTRAGWKKLLDQIRTGDFPDEALVGKSRPERPIDPLCDVTLCVPAGFDGDDRLRSVFDRWSGAADDAGVWLAGDPDRDIDRDVLEVRSIAPDRESALL